MKHLLLIALMTILGCAQVDTGEVGVKKQMGEVQEQGLQPGWHFYNPITENIVVINVRERKVEDTTPCFTKDTQNASISYALTYYPEMKRMISIYSHLGGDWEAKILRPVILGNLKNITGQYIADELIGKRYAVRNSALEAMRSHLAQRGVIVTNLEITNIDFDEAYERAVEAKAVAVQRAAEARNKTVEIEENAKQKIISARAEAESMRIRSEALERNKSLVEYEAVQRWDGKLPHYMMSGTVPFFTFGQPVSSK